MTAGVACTRCSGTASGPSSRWRWPPSSTGRTSGPSCWSRPTSRPAAASATPSSTGWWRATPWPSSRPAGPVCATTAPEGQNNPDDPAIETVSVFIESWAPPPQMLIFGAVDFTAGLAKVAKVLGYRVVVCDAREIFATKRRFPMADEVVVGWPGAVFAERGAGPRPARRGVHPHPRPEVRRAGHRGRAGHAGRLHRRDGLPQDPRQAHGAPGRGRHPRAGPGAGAGARSGWTSARARRRRPRSRSAPRSSPCAPAARLRRCATARAPSTDVDRTQAARVVPAPPISPADRRPGGGAAGARRASAPRPRCPCWAHGPWPRPRRAPT